MGDTISFTREGTTEVNTNKNGYTEAQQREYMVRTASDLVKENRKVQEEELYTDSNFIDSMRILYNKEQGMDAETPEDKELVKWGLGYLADVNYNLVDLGEAAYDFSEATDLEKMAMAYGLDTYDSKDVTMDGVQRFAEAFATDPTNLIGFGTLGAGFAAKFTGKTLAKQAFKKMLMNPANIAAVEGAAFLGAEDTMRQTLDVEIGAQEEYSAAQGLASVAVGAVGGKALGEVAAWAGKKMGKVPKETIDEVQAIQAELNRPNIKAEFGPELFVGGIAGVQTDEEGNVTFDPVKFMEGFLAGHVAKRIAANPKINAKAKKEALAYAQRLHDRLEQHPAFGFITGTFKAVDDRGGKGLLARQAEEKAKSIKPKGKEVYNPESEKKFIIGEDGNVYWESRRGWRESKQFGLKQKLEEIDRIGIDKYNAKLEKERIEYEAELKKQKEIGESPESYKDQHTAPTRDQDNTTSIDDLTKIYPEDVYSKDGARFYGHGEKAKDDIAMYILRKIKGNPDAKVTIYRAIPKDIDAEINPGDWVTITKAYAKEHGDARFNGKYKLLEKEVKASDVITDGNSIHEQGYDPK